MPGSSEQNLTPPIIAKENYLSLYDVAELVFQYLKKDILLWDKVSQNVRRSNIIWRNEDAPSHEFGEFLVRQVFSREWNNHSAEETPYDSEANFSENFYKVFHIHIEGSPNAMLERLVLLIKRELIPEDISHKNTLLQKLIHSVEESWGDPKPSIQSDEGETDSKERITHLESLVKQGKWAERKLEDARKIKKIESDIKYLQRNLRKIKQLLGERE